jgi:beta-lactamase superfamily II metal-dependent hydrolase
LKNHSKKSQIIKIIVCEVILLISLLTFWGRNYFVGQNKAQEVNQDTLSKETTEENVSQEKLKVTFFDVGKGDCILIETHQGNVMIDTGYDENGEEILGWLKEKSIASLDYLILTHPDKDHIGGSDQIINNTEVKNIIDTDCVVDSEDYHQYKQAASDNGIDILTLKDEMEINLGGMTMILYPPEGTFKGENDYSIVVKLKYGTTDFLFAADAEKARLKELMSQIPDLQSMVLKVPHHGTMMKNSEEFFEMVAPQYSVITSDLSEVYEEVADMLESQGSKVYETGNGSITIISDGTTIECIQ